jgi:hypothetical protein
MNGERLMTALRGIDDKYVEEAYAEGKSRKHRVIKIASVICACLAAVLITVPLMKPDGSSTLSGSPGASDYLQILYSKNHDDPKPYFSRAEAGGYIMTDALKKAFDSCPDDSGLAVAITDANGGNVEERVLMPFAKRVSDIMRESNVDVNGLGFGITSAVIYLPKRLLFLLDELQCPDDMALVLSWAQQ